MWAACVNVESWTALNFLRIRKPFIRCFLFCFLRLYSRKIYERVEILSQRVSWTEIFCFWCKTPAEGSMDLRLQILLLRLVVYQREVHMYSVVIFFFLKVWCYALLQVIWNCHTVYKGSWLVPEGYVIYSARGVPEGMPRGEISHTSEGQIVS